MSHQIYTYAELKHQIHDDLRLQHPEWIDSSGECPQCDEYEKRLNELLETVERNEPEAGQENSKTSRGHESVFDRGAGACDRR